MSAQWGRYPWGMDKIPGVVHPDDVDVYNKVVGSCLRFECVSEDGDYITLRYADEYFRVKGEYFEPWPAPKYGFKQRVRITKKDIIGTIEEIYWHYNNAAYYYYVRPDGLKKMRRYYDEDLEPVTE